MRRFLFLLLSVCVSVAVVTAGPASAGDDWPNKPIRMSICFAAGGTTDMSIRLLSSIMERELGQTIVCENKPGGGGAVAAGLAANKKPDGYDLFTLVTAAGVTNPHRQDLPYDPRKDFTMISRVAQWHYALAVTTDSPFKTFKDFMDYALAHPGEVSYGISGVGTSQHLVMEWFKAVHNVQWQSIPFKSGTEAVTACMGGHVTAMAGVTEWLPQVKSGQMRLLATFDEARMKEFPDVPTLKELGFDIVAPSFLSIAGPAGIPQDIVEKIDGAIAKAAQDPGFVEMLDKVIMINAYQDHKAFQETFEKEYVAVGEIMKKAGLAKK